MAELFRILRPVPYPADPPSRSGPGGSQIGALLLHGVTAEGSPLRSPRPRRPSPAPMALVPSLF